MLRHTHRHKYQRQEVSRNIEVETDQRRDRHWSEEEKARIVAESFMPGADELSDCIRCFAAVYVIEARIRGLSAEERRAARQTETKPLKPSRLGARIA